MLARVKIDNSGQVVNVLAAGEQDRKLLAWIQDCLRRNWTFYPALQDGRPTESELNVFFLIHAKGNLKISEPEPLSMPVTLIQFFWSQDLFPGNDDVDRWTVTYGLLQEGSVVE